MYKKKRIIISLTSWPKRIANVATVIGSLLNQKLMPDLIELNLSLEEFHEKEKNLPEELIDLIKNNSQIEINWIEGNDGVFKKIIPTLKKFYGEEYYLLSVDDDYIYRNDYVELMVNYINSFNSDTFSLSRGRVIGNRQIYKSICFQKDFWEKLTQDVINTRIDDSYIEYYLRKKGKNFSNYEPKEIHNIRKAFNPVFPNSHNTATGQYSIGDIHRAKQAINRITFENEDD